MIIITRYCIQCGKEMVKTAAESKKYYSGKIYCGFECSGKGRTKEPKKKSIEQIERAGKKAFRAGYSDNGEKSHPLYNAWRNMKRRCYGNYKNSKYYKNYGGRGITVCDEWKDDYNTFLGWALKSNWEHGLTIDRTDNNGNYEPDNCKWITQREQLLNRRNNANITYKGITKTKTEWARELGIDYRTFSKRIRVWSIEKAFNEPVHKEHCTRG